MPLAESLVIWDNSIVAARHCGRLAGWIVAGHFYNLLVDSENSKDPAAVSWLMAQRKFRTTWLDGWIREDASNTLDYAKRAQQMMLSADLFSLWLCCDCPVEQNDNSLLRQSTMKLRADKLLDQFRFVSPECTVRESVSKQRVEELSWIVPVEPFPFKTQSVALTARARAVSMARYASWPEVEAAAWPVELNWQLVRAV